MIVAGNPLACNRKTILGLPAALDYGLKCGGNEGLFLAFRATGRPPFPYRHEASA
jgi:hypothetical protein